VTETDPFGDPRQGFTAYEVSMPAGKITLRFAFKPVPQTVGNDKAEDAITEEFEALVAALGGWLTPAATRFGSKCARMGQSLLEEFAVGELVTDEVRQFRYRQNHSRQCTP
jgi:hypothetical protein